MDHHQQIDFTNQNNPFLAHCHIRAQELSSEHAVLTAAVCPELLNTSGTVHGGLLYTMADGAVSMLARADGNRYVTLDGSFQYLRNVSGAGELAAVARLVRRGQHVSVIRVEVTETTRQKLLAIGTFTCCKADVPAE